MCKALDSVKDFDVGAVSRRFSHVSATVSRRGKNEGKIIESSGSFFFPSSEWGKKSEEERLG